MSDEQLDRIAASQQARDARTQAVRDRGIERGKQREERMEIRRAAQTPGGLATRLMQGGEQGGVDPLLRMAAFQGNPIAMKALGEMSVAGVGAKTQLGVAQIDADVRREGIKQSREMSDADLEFTASGTVASDVSIAGSAELAFTGTAKLSAIRRLIGSSEIVVSAASTLSGGGRLRGLAGFSLAGASSMAGAATMSAASASSSR
jgi:hypothetical protein